MQKIIFVKKLLEDGSPCPKCLEVQDRIEQESLMHRLDEILIADVRDPQSPGFVLAQSLEVTRAPFFFDRTQRRSAGSAYDFYQIST